MSNLALIERWQGVIARVRAAEVAYDREHGSVKLLAVSKYHSADDIRILLAQGQRAFGESYVQEALEKQTQCANEAIEWHFIGPVQSNKTRKIANGFAWVHSIDRFKVAARLSEQRESDTPLNLCLQINLSGEASKSGTTLDGLTALAEQVAVLPNIQLRGLMCLPAKETEPMCQRAVFAQLRKAAEALSEKLDLPLDTLSMGMSNDLEAAIAEGATIVRIGSDIFGPRA